MTSPILPCVFFFFSSRRRHTRLVSDWSSDVCSSDLVFAWFESQGMYVYDMDGKLLWSKDLGDKKMRSEFGEGRSEERRVGEERKYRRGAGEIREKGDGVVNVVCAM